MANVLEINDCLDNIQPKRFDAWVILVNEHSSRDRVCLGLCLGLKLIDWLKDTTFRLKLDHPRSIILVLEFSYLIRKKVLSFIAF